MSHQLHTVLGAEGGAVIEELAAAMRELAPLRQRVQELELLIANGRRLVDGAGVQVPWPPTPSPKRPPTLHEVMRHVLLEHGNYWLTTTYVAREIAQRNLYRRRDGLPPSVREVSARVSTYAGLFRRWGWYFRLWDTIGVPEQEHRFGPRF